MRSDEVEAASPSEALPVLQMASPFLAYFLDFPLTVTLAVAVQQLATPNSLSCYSDLHGLDENQKK